MADTLVWRASQPHTCNSIVRPFLSLYNFILAPLYLNHLSTTVVSHRIESHLMKESECVDLWHVVKAHNRCSLISFPQFCRR